MAAPSLSIVELSEDDRKVIIRANISAGGDADITNYVLADIGDYDSVGPVAVALSINRIWWSFENMNVELKFEADTPVKALTLSGNGSYDFNKIYGIKNPGGSGSTGSILLDTYGIAINAALGCVGSLILELWKVRAGESGGEIDEAATSSLFTPEVPEISGGIVIGGNSTAAGYIKLLEDSDNGTNWIIVQAPAALAGNVTLTLPTTDGNTDQILKTDGSGNLSWVDNTAGGAITPATALQGASLKLYEITENGTSYVELKAPDALGGNVSLVLPADDGDSGEVLGTNGSGTLDWIAQPTAASLNLEIGTDTQAYSANLTDLASKYTAASASGAASLALAEDTDEGAHKVTITVPALAGDYTLTLPTTNGDADQVLKTDGDGNTSWTTPASGLTEYTSASASSAGSIYFAEDTDNGAHKVTIQAPAALDGDVTLTLPDTDGDASQVLTTNGSGVLSWTTPSAGSAGGLASVQVFTTSGTWTKPAGINFVVVEVQGSGGGSGGVTASAGNSTGGAGAGGYIKAFMPVAVSGDSQTVTVGAGGTATNNGNASSFGTIIATTGGAGTASNAKYPGDGGTASASGVGEIVVQIQKGGPGTPPDSVATMGGTGGHAFLGTGTRGTTNADAVAAVWGYGGGAGGIYTTASAYTGAAGRDGIVIVWEYK